MSSLREIQLNGVSVPLHVRRNSRARRILTRIDATLGAVVLVLPKRASESQGYELLYKHADWLLQRLSEIPPRIAFADGATIPICGEPHRICHLPNEAQRVRIVNGRLEAGGSLESLPQRLNAWLRAQARSLISPLATEKASAIGRKPLAVSIRDQKSRWGSCSSAGRLSFNWRLMMAPHHVLDYVVAHESAHLAQMNHSAEFWAIVAGLTVDIGSARNWLRRQGSTLHRYG